MFEIFTIFSGFYGTVLFSILEGNIFSSYLIGLTSSGLSHSISINFGNYS